ncbi:hypothetical protein GLOTRDRAFT_94982 [Gloeophyllum trabeum ATCC 11539]|uniref:Uncharacterized protein n=1 Tax=Gloeophyllum trabeum (strain ATCC 11539 / FP-39264 / Madison 617) TaxID=670483 RepID=S7PZK6_GLOTA|nr:uncharacterized protein GLOTRDRAFT_94982 [Gloeophyllum trabeum ATCC 11539]EPQ52903.1 hypothetical protein GLOTRDRAFT_94982 [Gloeophyllum trabeum ATCC 11539]
MINVGADERQGLRKFQICVEQTVKASLHGGALSGPRSPKTPKTPTMRNYPRHWPAYDPGSVPDASAVTDQLRSEDLRVNIGTEGQRLAVRPGPPLYLQRSSPAAKGAELRAIPRGGSVQIGGGHLSFGGLLSGVPCHCPWQDLRVRPLSGRSCNEGQPLQAKFPLGRRRDKPLPHLWITLTLDGE